MLKYFIAILAVGLFSTNLFTQVKFEKESRIKRHEVPSKALAFIDSLSISNKVKWYLEEGLERSSIEAKFKKDRKKHSVEFDALGNIEDIEIEMDWKELQADLKDTICAQLQTDCLKHKIAKVQIQFSGTYAALLHKLKEAETNPELTTKYEIVVRCRSKNSVDLVEYLFSDAGQQLSVSKIIFKNSSNLEY
jgi:hypothetical protein